VTVKQPFRLKTPLRAGMAEKHLTVGAGIRTKFATVDVAYAHDPFLDRGSLYTQVQLAW